ncbi:MAG: hypothetical protein WDZ86_06775 [Gammaproteobacteria bacterium]
MTAVFSVAMYAPLVQAAPDFPAPPRAQVQWVSNNMVYNGRTMQVRSFESRLSAERVLEYYRQLWQRGEADRPGYQETDALEPWQMITRIEDEHLLTVQVITKGNDSSGYLSVSHLDELIADTPEIGQGFPKMHGSKVFNDIMTPDQGKDGRTLLISNEYSITANSSYYRDWYENRGWRLDMEKTVAPGKQEVLGFSKGREKVNLVISHENNTTNIVANSSE